MFLKEPYGKNYRLKDIHPALEFYYGLMDKVDIRFYLTPDLHFQRKDIDLTINWLKSFKPEDEINNIWISNPSIQIGIEKIPGWQELAEENLPYNFVPIFSSLDSFYQAGNNILVLFAKRKIEESLNQIKTSDEKITYLIKQKFHYSNNPDTYPKKFVNDVTPFLNGQIEQYNRPQNPDRLLSWELTLKLTTKWKEEQEENSMLTLRQKWS